MNQYFPYIIAGLVTGSLYGLAGMGLVLTYKTSGVFNFAHGAVASLAAYIFFTLHQTHGVPWPIAMAISVLGLGLVMGLVLERLARGLAGVSPALQIVATVGVLITVQGVLAAVYGTTLRSVSSYLPTHNVRIGGLNVGVDQIIVFLVAFVAAVGLYLFFRFTKLGLSTQAVVDDPVLLSIGGTNPITIRSLSWIIGAAFACLSGVLLVPTVGLDATILTLLVVQAFGAAAVGLFFSLPLTYAGGLLIGVIASLSTRYVGDFRFLSGFPSAVPFLVLFLVLIVVPKRRLVDLGSQVRLLTKAPPEFSIATKIGAGVTTAAGLLVLPLVIGTRLPVYTNAAIFIIIFLSLHLLVRTSGQVSLAHASFAAVGAAGFSHLITTFHLPWLLAVLGAGLLAVPAGVIVAVPAIRLSGLYLAVATFGFGILMEKLVYPTSFLFGAAGAVSTPRPHVLSLDSDRGFYYVVIATVALMAGLSTFIIRGRLGRLLRAMSDSPVALSTLGTGVNSIRVLIFCVSAFMAGIAGALFGSLSQSINGVGFNFFASLTWLTILVISGAPFRYAPLPTALLGGVNIAIIPAYITNAKLLSLLPALFGLAAIANALLTDRGHASAPDEGEGQPTVNSASRRREKGGPSPVTERFRETPVGGG